PPPPRGDASGDLPPQRPPYAPPAIGPRHSEVEDLPLVRRVMRDHVAPDQAAHLRDEERNSRRHAFREIATRPGIGEYGALDRRDVVDVSRRGRTNPGRDGRGAPPIEPALQQGVRKRARRWPDRRAHDPRRRARADRAASWRREAGSRAAREESPPSGSVGRRSGRRRRPPRGGGAPGRSARAPPASAPWALRGCRPGRGGRRTSRRTLDRAAR